MNENFIIKTAHCTLKVQLLASVKNKTLFWKIKQFEVCICIATIVVDCTRLLIHAKPLSELLSAVSHRTVARFINKCGRKD